MKTEASCEDALNRDSLLTQPLTIRVPGSSPDTCWAHFVPLSAVSGWRIARVPSAASSRIPTAYVPVSSKLPGNGTRAPSSTIGMAATGQGHIVRIVWVLPLITSATPRDEQDESPGEHPAGRGRSSLVRMHDQLLQTHPGQYDAKGQWEMAVDEKVVACVRDRSAGVGSVCAWLRALPARFYFAQLWGTDRSCNVKVDPPHAGGDGKRKPADCNGNRSPGCVVYASGGAAHCFAEDEDHQQGEPLRKVLHL